MGGSDASGVRVKGVGDKAKKRMLPLRGYS